MILLVTTALAADGELVGIAFQPDGKPAGGVTVRVGDAEVRTDPGGGWLVAVPAGTVEVTVGSTHVPDVPIVEGRTTELLVTLGGAVSLEAPAGSGGTHAVQAGPPGTLTGVITDGQAPLSGVRVFVRGSDASAVTDKDGRFSLTLGSTTWDVSLVRPGYASRTEAWEVVAGETRSVTVALEKAGLELDSLTVTAPRIAGAASSVLDERKEASTVSDVLGAEQMSRSGDSDAASALRRVTGLTVIGGKYVYVRGLGDRYSATLLNGSSLPSPEPEKRVVPLDLFPTSLIEAVVVQKTFSPDRPAEFGGGVVEVRTRSVPDEPVFKLGVSGTYRDGTSLTLGEVGPTGPTDWLGFGTDWRALPPDVAAASADEPLQSGGIFSEGGYSAEELEEFGEEIPNRWGVTERTLPPDFGLTLDAGRTFELGDVKLGALTGFVYDNGWDIDQGVRTVYANGADGLTPSRVTSFVDTQNRVRMGGALSVGLKWKDYLDIRSTTLLDRASINSAITYEADDPTGSNDTRSTRTGWEETQLLFEQAALEAHLGPVEVDARYAYAVATRREPDRREWVYTTTDDGYVLSQRGSWNDIEFVTLDDTTHDAGLDVTVPVPFLREGSILKVGGGHLSRVRASTTRRFSYQFHGSEGIDLGAPIEDVMVPENIGAEEDGDPGYLQLEENTISSDDYTAGQELWSGYAMADAAWHPRVRTLAGVRVERSVQTVSTFELFDTSDEPVEADLGSTDFLPAGTVTFGLGPASDPDTMLLRLGYGRTLSRPEFRELSQVAYYDYRTGRLLYGNPDLHRATIDNVDLRWELYPAPGETVSAGVFFKYFDHPIESVIAVSAVSGSVGTFANATSATNFGGEVEVRKSFDFLRIPDLWASANVSLISSRVDLSDTEGNQTSDERPLQGQSPWVINAQLSYENPDIRTTVALLYNVFGPRIVDVGTSGIPDTYEMPMHRVDLVWTQGIGKNVSLKLKGGNLLDWPSRQKTGDAVSEETREGWSVGAGVSVGI